jgi:hypothetical protein
MIVGVAASPIFLFYLFTQIQLLTTPPIHETSTQPRPWYLRLINDIPSSLKTLLHFLRLTALFAPSIPIIQIERHNTKPSFPEPPLPQNSCERK